MIAGLKKYISHKTVFFSCTILLLTGLLSLLYSKDPDFNHIKSKDPFIREIEEDKIELGRQLFFDKRLSIDNSVSCASCHDPNKAFCDNLPTSIGVGGQKNLRNAPSILNSDSLKTVMFDAHLKTLELQILVPIQEKNEMANNMKLLIPKLRKIETYQKQANKIFGRDFDAFVLTRSIAAFERSLKSRNSRFDQYMKGNKKALTRAEKNGMDIFMNKLDCASCHPPPNFTTFLAENNGFPFNYSDDPGRFRVTKDSLDIGKFKVPSLRNISLTSPYMHNGSIKDLNSVIELYASGGSSHPNKNPIIKPFYLSNKEKRNLILFLESLNDTSYMDKLNLNGL